MLDWFNLPAGLLSTVCDAMIESKYWTWKGDEVEVKVKKMNTKKYNFMDLLLRVLFPVFMSFVLLLYFV